MINGLIDALKRLVLGNNTIDNLNDALDAHKKANESREDAQRAIDEADLLKQAEKYKKG